MTIRTVLMMVLLAAPLEAAAQTLSRVRIDSPQARSLADKLHAEGFDILRPTIRDDSFELIVSDAEWKGLEQRGLEPILIARGRPFRDIQGEWDKPDGYLNLAEILAAMDAAAAAFPDVCQVVDLTATYNMPTTVEGRHLFAVKISDNVTQIENEPATLLVSNHHAREIVNPVIALHTIEQLTTRYGSDPQITRLVDENEIWIAPVWNPDGYNWVFIGDNFWRKNRRVFPQGIGVDQNRNYPFGWGSPCGGSSTVTSPTYRGPAPSSEPETQTMIAFAEDRRFARVADMHSSGREVRQGFGCLNYPFSSFLQSEAGDLAATMAGYVPASSCCTGGDIHYHMATKGTHAFLWETALEFQPPHANALAEAALVLPSFLALLERPISVSGRVTDLGTGDPLEAAIEYVGVVFENGETNSSGGPLGRYHATLPPGTYTLEFSAPGFNTLSRVVNVTSTSAEILDVQLGIPALTIQFISGPSGLIDPGTAPDVEVEITPGSQQIVPGSETVFYRYDAGAFVGLPLNPIGGDRYAATLPAVDCGDTPEYYFQAQGDGGTTVTLPFDAPTTVFDFAVGTQVEIANFNFETAPGWTAENLGATSGDWERGVPVNDPNWQYDPISDSDGSGQCFLTQNELGNTDVDEGAVRLTSPNLDMSAGDVTLSYDYYLNMTNPAGVDMLLVEVSSSGVGGPWTEMARHETDGGLAWRTHTLTTADFTAAGVALTGTMRVRFTANDADPQSIVESGLDAFDLSVLTCAACYADCDGNGTLDIFDFLCFQNSFVLSEPYACDCDPDPACDIFDFLCFQNAFVGGCP
ncbi:MAG: carboxypeptidase regulatory-like domain-containing protein [Planctomycetes bacterium]|nr:carboxypeptidase regulatory-like domain-containing protein [Planctomycetota bacterium]